MAQEDAFGWYGPDATRSSIRVAGKIPASQSSIESLSSGRNLSGHRRQNSSVTEPFTENHQWSGHEARMSIPSTTLVVGHQV